MFEEEKICGTCKWHMKDTEDEDGDWVCDNHDGEYFGDYTTYEITCPDWERRE